MAHIEARCPECGPVTCATTNIQLKSFEGSGTFYVFQCPTCGRSIRRPADSRAIEILIEEGAHFSEETIPAEARECHDGPPFTAEDVLTFHELLAQPDWFRAVLR